MSYLDDYLEKMNWAPSDGQCGYRYSSPTLTFLHVTSAIQDDQAAIEYIAQIEKWFPKTRVFIIEKRDAGQQKWRLIHRVEEAIESMSFLRDEPVLVQPPPEVPSPVKAKDETSRPLQAPTRVIEPPPIRPVQYDPDYFQSF